MEIFAITSCYTETALCNCYKSQLKYLGQVTVLSSYTVIDLGISEGTVDSEIWDFVKKVETS